MIFKKNRKNADDYFSGKRIAVLGLGPRNGTTHIAISLSNYLSDSRHKRVCLAEHNRHGDLVELIRVLGSDMSMREYSYHRVTYIPFFSDRDSMPEIEYDCMVFDFGSDFMRNMNIVNLCDIKIAVGMDAPWRKTEYAILKDLTGRSGSSSSWRLFVNLGNPAYLEEKDIYGIDSGCFPFEPDPMYPCRETITFLEDIL